MSYLRLGNKEALLSAIRYSDNEVVYLIGSPLSCSYKNTQGIPDVIGMLDIIKEQLSGDPDLSKSYENELSSCSADTEKYQQSFSFLAQYTSPKTVNGIIRKATLQAYKGNYSQDDIHNEKVLAKLQEDVNSWSIPPATSSLAKILVNSSNAAKTILTPNFDPLLSIALAKLNKSPTRTVLHGDSNTEQFQSPEFNIIHFHGYWLDTDTLHTPVQLTCNRPLLKQSLMRVLSKKTLVVLGYGGWDDVFTQVLFSLVSDNGAEIDIIWGFYESNLETIENKYSRLLNSVKPALQRGRFRAYGGINCHEFLSDMAEKLIIKHSNQECTELKVDTLIKNKSLEDSFKNNTSELTAWKLFLEKAHAHIRITERSYLAHILDKNKKINITAEWGISHAEFIHSVTSDQNSSCFESPIFKIDLNNVRNKEQLIEKIEQETRTSLHVFIQKLPRKKNIIFFDNVGSGLKKDSDLSAFIDDLKDILDIISDFNEYSRIILVSKKELDADMPSMTISRLEDYDAKNFILNHSQLTEQLDANAIDTLIDIAQGIPSSLDRCIKSLNLLSTNELYEIHYTPESQVYTEATDFPIEIVNRVEKLAASQEIHSQRSYQLLQTLSVLEYGDSFINLRKSNKNHNYQPTNIQELHDLELVEAIKIKKNIVELKVNVEEKKLLKLPTAVRNYVYSKLSSQAVYEIAKCVTAVHLGTDWQSGVFKLSQLSKQSIDESDTVIGSTPVLLTQLLRGAIEFDIGKDIEAAFRACSTYCNLISKAGRYKDVISFSKQTKAIAKESDKIKSLALFDLLEGSAYRMLSKHDLAKQLLQLALDEKMHLSKPDKVRALVNLMFLYDSIDNTTDALKIANQVLELESKNSDALLVSERLSNIDNIDQLKTLEQKFRNKNKTRAANNACFKLYELEDSYAKKVYWLDRILKSGQDDIYNKMRAITHKATLDGKADYTPTQEELSLLHFCYVFCFSQRLTSLFHKAHKVLWKHYEGAQNINALFNLYRHSSLYWRVYDDKKRESIYSRIIRKLVNDYPSDSLDTNSYENAYVMHRILSVVS